MSDESYQETLEAGMRWVEKRLQELADGSGVQIDKLAWEHSDEDWKKVSHTLVVRVGNQKYRCNFDDLDLQDFQRRADLENILRELVKSLVPPKKKIGF